MAEDVTLKTDHNQEQGENVAEAGGENHGQGESPPEPQSDEPREAQEAAADHAADPAADPESSEQTAEPESAEIEAKSPAPELSDQIPSEETTTELEQPEVEEAEAAEPDAEASPDAEVEAIAPEPPKSTKLRKSRKSAKTPEPTELTLDSIARQAEFTMDHERLLFQSAVNKGQNRHPQMRLAAVRELRKIKHPAVVQALAFLADDSAIEVRKASLEALADRQDDSVIQIFGRHMRDPNARMRMMVLRTIYRLNPQKATPYLLDALADRDASVRRRAVVCLNWNGARAVAPDLIPLLNDPDVDVRMAVVKALETVGDKPIVPVLFEALEDGERRVCECAHRALISLTGRDFVYPSDSFPQKREAIKADWESWWRANRNKLQ